jgi:hypothetical protein
MKYTKQAKAYIDSEHIRFLGDENKVPTIEERVMAAFDAGFRYFIVETTKPDKDTINFPNWNE